MVVFPNSKINLGLRILRKRPDGYHDLETIFYPLQVHDVLEYLPSPGKETVCHVSGIPIAGDPASNLVIKAWKLLKRDFPQLPIIECWLHKIIPMGAGLGGGSADGAFLLKTLNRSYELGLDQETLIRYALELGSDCPFFLLNKPCIGRGRGEIMEELELDLSGYHFTLIHPGIHISTAWAFQQVSQQTRESESPADIICTSLENWKGRLVNDFEKPVVSAHPEIGSIIDHLYEQGAIYAAMSGSGSAVFGISREHMHIKNHFPAHYFIREGISAGIGETS